MVESVTIKEAMDIHGASESTMRRVVKELRETPELRKHLQPSPEEVEKLDGKRVIWRIDKRWLSERLLGGGERSTSREDVLASPMQAIHGERIVELQRRVQGLEGEVKKKDDRNDKLLEQIRTKDEQHHQEIAAMHQRIHESNVNIASLTDRIGRRFFGLIGPRESAIEKMLVQGKSMSVAQERGESSTTLLRYVLSALLIGLGIALSMMTVVRLL